MYLTLATLHACIAFTLVILHACIGFTLVILEGWCMHAYVDVLAITCTAWTSLLSRCSCIAHSVDGHHHFALQFMRLSTSLQYLNGTGLLLV
jgi:hypothetical protein